MLLQYVRDVNISGSILHFRLLSRAWSECALLKSGKYQVADTEIWAIIYLVQTLHFLVTIYMLQKMWRECIRPHTGRKWVCIFHEYSFQWKYQSLPIPKPSFFEIGRLLAILGRFRVKTLDFGSKIRFLYQNFVYFMKKVIFFSKFLMAQNRKSKPVFAQCAPPPV